MDLPPPDPWQPPAPAPDPWQAPPPQPQPAQWQAPPPWHTQYPPQPRPRWRGRIAALVLVLVVIAVGAWVIGRRDADSDGPRLPVLPIDAAGPRSLGAGPVTVPLLLARYAGGGVTAWLAVRLDGHPYAFVLDSGADVTVLDTSVARQLHLTSVGGSGQSQSLKCRSTFTAARLKEWQLGSARLAPAVVGVQKTGFAGQRIGGVPVAGLLGADVQSASGRVRIDYRHSRVVFDAPAPTGGTTAAAAVLRQGRAAQFSTTVAVPLRGSTKNIDVLVDTGASRSELTSAVAASLELKRAAAPTHVGDASGCSVKVGQSELRGARVGSAPLPAVEVLTAPDEFPGHEIDGLLGSDVLSTFGTVTMDWTRQRITLGG